MFICKANKDLTRNNPVLLVTGDGKNLPKDINTFLQMEISHDVMCIGRSIKAYPSKVDHYADIDADAGKWVIENLMSNHPDKGNPVTHTLGDVPWVNVGWEIEDCPIKSEDIMWHGSTGLFAVLIGLAMGYESVCLAGCPMDSKGHWYFPEQTEGPRWTMESYQSWLEFASTDESLKVRSMSGYTRTLLGPVTKEFCDGYIDGYIRNWIGR